MRLLVIILIASTTSLWGQREDELCKSGKRTAEERLARGQIYFPRYTFTSSITLRKILEMDYGIIDDFYNDYCVQFDEELKCHDRAMEEAIAAKWGRNFLKEQRKIANELEKEDKGFKEAFNSGAKKSIESDTILDSLRTNYKRTLYDLVLTISPSGQVTKYKIFYPALMGVATEVTDEGELKLISTAIKNHSDNWTPGEIKGRPIETSVILTIEI